MPKSSSARTEIDDLLPFIEHGEDYPSAVREQAEVRIKYAGYLDRQQQEIDKASRHEQTLPAGYARLRRSARPVERSLAEAGAAPPATIGQAGRISGVTPAAISLLLVHLKRTGTLYLRCCPCLVHLSDNTRQAGHCEPRQRRGLPGMPT